MQFGTSPYLPDGDGTTSHHPFTNGVALGVSGGFELLDGLSLIANFEHTSASSRDGQVENALDRVDGVITYQTVVLGLRSVRTIGPGRMFGELAAGVVLPFETQLQYVYAPALSGLPMPVQGAGTKTDEYNLGFGAHGALGYQVDVSSRYYLTAAAKLKGFATTNAGRKTRLDNFVTDFAAASPGNGRSRVSSGRDRRRLAQHVFRTGSQTPNLPSGCASNVCNKRGRRLRLETMPAVAERLLFAATEPRVCYQRERIFSIKSRFCLLDASATSRMRVSRSRRLSCYQRVHNSRGRVRAARSFEKLNELRGRFAVVPVCEQLDQFGGIARCWNTGEQRAQSWSSSTVVELPEGPNTLSQ